MRLYVRPVNFAGIPFEALGRGYMTSYSILQNSNGNTDPRSWMMMPQSSMECFIRGTEEPFPEDHNWKLFPCIVNHMHFCFCFVGGARVTLKFFAKTYIQNLIRGTPFGLVWNPFSCSMNTYWMLSVYCSNFLISEWRKQRSLPIAA